MGITWVLVRIENASPDQGARILLYCMVNAFQKLSVCVTLWPASSWDPRELTQ